MTRKCWVLLCLGTVLLLGADAALAKAVKQNLDLGGGAGAKVILNFCEEEAQVIVNVNAWGLAPETTYTVQVFDDSGSGIPVASEQFTTKPDKSKNDKEDNGKGNDNKPKPRGKSKGHVNIHIPWDPLALPPDLAAWSVTITAPAPPAP